MIKKYLLYALLFSLNSYSPMSHTALSASTANYITGTAPRFNAQLEQEIAQRRFSLLKLNYQGNAYNNDNIKTMPLVDPLQTVQSFIQQVTLSPIVLNEEDTFDIDGDGDMTASFISTSMTVLDKNNQVVDLNSNFCEKADSAPLSLQLSAELNLSTRFGVPNTTPYSVSQQYKLFFKPTICYLKPSLTYGDGKYAGGNNVWNPKQGFIYDESKTTFPTTGMDGLNYDIKVLGVDLLVEENINMIYSNASNVNLLLTSIDNQTLNVKLSGPTANKPKTFTPNVFNILLGPALTYRFKINNWFIHNNDQSLTWANANSWCNQLGGNQRYILPTIAQLSNASADISSSSGANQNYTRAIGQGLLAEWGSLVSYELMTNGYIWSRTQRAGSGGRYFDAHNASGFISSPVLTFEEKSLCVSK